MKHNSNLRLSDEQLSLADTLIPVVASNPTIKALGREVSRATVLRLAVELGLQELRRSGSPSHNAGK